jgi:hypothetical protein
VCTADYNDATSALELISLRFPAGANGVTPIVNAVNRLKERRVPTGSDQAAADSLSLQQRLMLKLQIFRRIPSIFFVIGASDGILYGSLLASMITSCGIALLSGLSLLNLTPAVPGWISGPAFVLPSLVHLGFTVLGSPWMGLQFETMLVEVNMTFAWCRFFSFAAPSLWVWVWRFLLFRLMCAAGAGKLSSGDPAWRDGTAMSYHYETQPLPNPISKLMHQLPLWWHKIETFATFVAEGPLALTFFASSPVIRWFGFLLTVGFNLAIGFTGNYGHLHMLCITMATAIVAETDSTAYTPKLLHVSPVVEHASIFATIVGYLVAAVAVIGALVYVVGSLPAFASNFLGLVELKEDIPGWEYVDLLHEKLERYHIVGRYNLFATMTRFRWELQLEGTCDGGQTWHAYRYHNKPGGPPASLDEYPKLLLPGYFLRSDWRMWFVPLQIERLARLGISPNRPELKPTWYVAMVQKILEGEPSVVDLVVTPPALQNKRLDGLRTLVYDYHFTDMKKDDHPPRTNDDGTNRDDSDPMPSPPVGDAPVQGGRPALLRHSSRNILQNALPPSAWEYGSVWKRRYVCLFDIQPHPQFVSASRPISPAGGKKNL